MSARGWQALVGRKVLAMHDELGGRAPAVVARHHDDIGQLLAVAALHMREELAERRLAGFSLALIDVMRDVFAEAVEHRLPVAGVVVVDFALT